VLDGLDAVPWHELHHANGTANDVPGFLRDLSAGSDAVRQGAIDEPGARGLAFAIARGDRE
jgi:hypothetical protein